MTDSTSLPDLGFLIGPGDDPDYAPPEAPAFDVDDAGDGWPPAAVPGGAPGAAPASGAGPGARAQGTFEWTQSAYASPAGDPEELTRGLNDRQRASVEHRGAPLLIMAGAGSGKTRVLTHRIAYLLATGQARAGQILAITFTNKAAAEMRERIAALVGDEAGRMWVSTFHSACVRILRYEHEAAGLSGSFTIYDAQDSQRLMQMVLKAQDVDVKRFTPKMVAARVSDLKNELIGPERYAEVAGKDPVSRIVAAAYAEYDKRLRDSNAVDFDDLIMRTVLLLQRNPLIAEHYHRCFRHILVDEYQDTNHAQYVLVRELVGAGDDGVVPAELTVVGDSDQSIYAFRGATIRNIEEFERDFPGARTILLEQNYRSTQNILSAANAVISRNQGRRPKNLWTQEGDGAPITVDAADSEHDEARFVVSEIDRVADAGADWGDIAVFYRTNAQSRALEELLVRQGIPYRVVGGTRFYERREIKDALAYLQVVSNPDDTVAARRVINLPKRGIGAKAEEAIAAHAATGCPSGARSPTCGSARGAPSARARAWTSPQWCATAARRGIFLRTAAGGRRARVPSPRAARRRTGAPWPRPRRGIPVAARRRRPKWWASRRGPRGRPRLSGGSSKHCGAPSAAAPPWRTSSRRRSTAPATSPSCAGPRTPRTPRASRTWRSCTRWPGHSPRRRPAGGSRTSWRGSRWWPTPTRSPRGARAADRSPS